MRRHRRIAGEGGYTLTEMLVVIGIICLIAAVLTPAVMGQMGRARARAAQLQLDTVAAAVESFRTDVGRYPTASEGLAALSHEPSSADGWTGPYVPSKSLKDPWGRALLYQPSADGLTFTVVTLGADGKVGGSGLDRDLKAPQRMTPLVIAAAAGVGLIAGSFATTAAIRATQGDGFVLGRSHCDHCQAGLGFVATAPVVSYVALGGRCRHCHSRIDALHPIGELTGAAVVAFAIAVTPNWRGVVIGTLGLALLASSVVDVKVRRLPDLLTLAVAAAALALAIGSGVPALLIGLAFAAGAFVILEALRRAFLAVRGRPGLGFGDVKLISALALWLGPATPAAVGGAAILGLVASLVLRPKDGLIVFGPAIAMSAFAVGVVREAGLWPTLM